MRIKIFFHLAFICIISVFLGRVYGEPFLYFSSDEEGKYILKNVDYRGESIDVYVNLVDSTIKELPLISLEINNEEPTNVPLENVGEEVGHYIAKVNLAEIEINDIVKAIYPAIIIDETTKSQDKSQEVKLKITSPSEIYVFPSSPLDNHPVPGGYMPPALNIVLSDFDKGTVEPLSVKLEVFSPKDINNNTIIGDDIKVGNIYTINSNIESYFCSDIEIVGLKWSEGAAGAGAYIGTIPIRPAGLGTLCSGLFEQPILLKDISYKTIELLKILIASSYLDTEQVTFYLEALLAYLNTYGIDNLFLMDVSSFTNAKKESILNKLDNVLTAIAKLYGTVTISDLPLLNKILNIPNGPSCLRVSYTDPYDRKDKSIKIIPANGTYVVPSISYIRNGQIVESLNIGDEFAVKVKDTQIVTNMPSSYIVCYTSATKPISNIPPPPNQYSDIAKVKLTDLTSEGLIKLVFGGSISYNDNNLTLIGNNKYVVTVYTDMYFLTDPDWVAVIAYLYENLPKVISVPQTAADLQKALDNMKKFWEGLKPLLNIPYMQKPSDLTNIIYVNDCTSKVIEVMRSQAKKASKGGK